MNRTLLAALAGLLAAAPATAQLAQKSLGASVHFQGYSFADGYPVTSANLLMTPVAFELPLGRTVSVDGYAAYAHGSVEVDRSVFNFTGPIDTRVRANWAATPWAIVTVGLNLPTGNSEHDQEEAVVASVLSTEVLGFREASWGLGFGATTGIATARRFGKVGIGFGASYRLSSEYKPHADSALTYSPGNETRLRLGFDTDIGTSKLTGGITLQHYADDQLDGRNLFQPGPRIRGDLAYSFRANANSSWTVYATDIWRQNGDVTLKATSGTSVRDSTFSAGRQNLLVTGVTGSLRLTSTFSIRPSADLRLISREAVGNEGWMAGIGTDVPLRYAGMDLFPSARLLFGQLSDQNNKTFGATGGEIALSVRF